VNVEGMSNFMRQQMLPAEHMHNRSFNISGDNLPTCCSPKFRFMCLRTLEHSCLLSTPPVFVSDPALPCSNNGWALTIFLLNPDVGGAEQHRYAYSYDQATEDG
jgi:hypothetical protein